jgi:hypothetical protein
MCLSWLRAYASIQMPFGWLSRRMFKALKARARRHLRSDDGDDGSRAN